MPSNGVEIIDGIPVILRDSVMYSFQPGSTSPNTQVTLGTYDSVTKKAYWSTTDDHSNWLNMYRENISSRSRK